MPFILIVFLTAIIILADLVSAWIYAVSPDHWGIDAVRYLREGLMVGLALWGMLRAHRLGLPFTLAAIYLAWIAAYALSGLDSLDNMVVLISAVKLALPATLLAAGFGCLGTPKRLSRYALFLAGAALSSVAFGAWDIGKTEFWTETLEYGHYLNGVKGITEGFDSYYVLPFNFFGYEEARRAGGLVAAPLAQGSFVAIGALLGFAVLLRRSLPVAVLILAAGLFGVWQSGTRGAMLILLLALPIFLIVGGSGRIIRNVALLAVLAAISFEAANFVFNYSVNLQDGSTIGHLEALQRNIEEIDQVLLVGPGIGASGAAAADVGQDLAGGGEGAIFAIAYQIGLPAALTFLALYASVLARAFAGRRDPDGAGDICLAVFALGVGFVVTFISSDHIFSLSGMGSFWIILGGVLAQSRRAGAEPS